MLSSKIRQEIGSKYEDFFPNEYLTKEESEDIWNETLPLNTEEGRQVLEKKGIAGYDSEKKLHYRKNLDVKVEELQLLILLDSNKKINAIKAILQAMFFTALGVMFILGIMGLWPLIILALLIIVIYGFSLS